MSERERVVFTPRVYLVGRQQVDDDALWSFLADEGVDSWSTDTEVAGQKLVEVALALEFARKATGRPDARASDVSTDMLNMRSPGPAVRAGLAWLSAVERCGDTYRVLSDYLFDKVARLHKLESQAGGLPLSLETYLERPALDLETYLTGLPREARTALRKRARESARSVLPNATETKLFVTGNARALRHFVEMRAAPAADAEIRRVAVAVLRLLAREAPNLFGDFTLTDLPEGGHRADTPHRKV
jgi:thymidylate synthase (FAD)